MKITYVWKRNSPSSQGGDSITIKITYSSFNSGEIDDLEKILPKSIIIMDVPHACVERKEVKT